MAEWDPIKRTWKFTKADLQAELEAGASRGEELRRYRRPIKIVDAAYLPEGRRFQVDLDNGSTFIFPVDRVQGVSGASDEDLADFEILGPNAIEWPAFDGFVPIPELMAGFFGTDAWMARFKKMGKKGGSSRSPAKAAAARENGKRGGRPKKTSPPEAP